MVGRGHLHEDIAKDKKTRKKEKGEVEYVFLIHGLPLGSHGHEAARKIRVKLEGSRRCAGEMPISVVESVSSMSPLGKHHFSLSRARDSAICNGARLNHILFPHAPHQL